MFLNLYNSIVRLHLEYAVIACTPLFKKDMVATENVQRKVTKLVRTINHFTYQERLNCLGLPSTRIEYWSERADLVDVYKIMNKINDVDKEKLFTVSNYCYTMKFTKRQHSQGLKQSIMSLITDNVEIYHGEARTLSA